MNALGQTCWAVVPVKANGHGKTRLAGVLTPAERKNLVGFMLEHVVTTIAACPSVDRVCLLSPSAQLMGGEITVLVDAGDGLNAALEGAMDLQEPRPDRVIILPADLPELTPVDVAMLANVSDETIAIASDRHGTGTNGLSLPQSCLEAFRFSFGNESYAAHCAETLRLGYKLVRITSPGTSNDVDEASDLTKLKASGNFKSK